MDDFQKQEAPNSMSSNKRILIIEDDFQLAKNIANILEEADFTAFFCAPLVEWRSQWRKFQPDLIILDINLSELSGFEICVALRRETKIPIIFVTGRESNTDEIRALNLGGDDYLRKPFSNEVLLARVERILKTRSFAYREEVQQGNLRLDLGKRIITNLKTKEWIELPGREFQIMFYLMGQGGKLVAREDLIDYLWSTRMYIDESALDVNLSRLRGKLAKISAKESIESVRGEGVRLCLATI